MKKRKATFSVFGFKIRMWEIFLTFFALFLVLAGLAIVWFSTIEVPDLDSFKTRIVSQSTKIYDKTGKILLYAIHNSAKRTIVPSSEISKNIKNAIVAIEDQEFYQHYGIKPSAILRAILVDIATLDFSQGGSTITQQVVKNSLLTPERTITRKLKEWVLAIKLEKMLDKDAILSIYLNESPFGGNIYGVEEASQTFFGKHSGDVTVAEGAYLASLLKAPTFFSPYGKNKNKLDDRKNLVLSKMSENLFITDEEYRKAKAENVVFLPQGNAGIKAPHFVTFVTSLLEKKYGTETLQNGGLRITTTLDYELQQKAEEIVKKFALENVKKFNAENAALVALDPKTGEILAMVGSRDYFDTEIDGNFNVATGFRQPGSAFKPIVYATAFNKGYQPETVLFDLSTEFSSTCSPEGKPKKPEASCYKPVNYDGQYRGPISLRSALAESRNIPAIQVLYLSGIKEALKTAQNMGITSLTNPDNYGLTLVLGGGEVSLLELSNAYGVFATNGIRNPYQSILKIENANGEMLEQAELKPDQVLPEETAEKINDVLSDDVARTPTFGARSLLHFPGRDVAVKTGTTNDYRDAWILGYTPNLVVGAWAGNNDNGPMEKKVAGLIVAPLWNAFMNEALKKIPDEKFKKPPFEDLSNYAPVLRGIWQGGQTYFVDKISGKLATEFTPPELREERAEPNVHSILYWVNKDDPKGAKPRRPESDSQFYHWEYPIQKWLQNNALASVEIPTEEDTVHSPDSAPKIKILTPNDSTKYASNERILISISHSGKYPLKKVDYFWNDTFVGSIGNEPFSFSFTPERFPNSTKTNTLRAVGYDSVMNKTEVETTVSISN